MTPQAPQWLRLPVELRERPQWLLAGPNDKGQLKVPVTVDHGGALAPGSSTDPKTWLEFDTAVEYATEFGYGIGYVLSTVDPYCVVDLDVKNAFNEPDPAKHTPPHHLEQMRMIVEELDSYSELSQSGQGLHVWCRAHIGQGLKRKSVEVYSEARFMVCTGHSIHAPAKPIAERQDEIGALVSNMRDSAEAAAQSLVEGVEEISDDEVMRRAFGADNSTKFRALWEGDWQQYGYPSQSEADLSLMSMLTFYSRNNEQCRRLFRRSALGARDKANKNDKYLDFTLRLIRGRQAKEDARDAAFVEFGRQTAERITAEDRAAAMARAAALQAAAAAAGGAPPLPPGPPPEPAAGPPSPPPPPVFVPSVGGLEWPPGLAGEVARFVYSSAPRPVKEIAIVAALGWLAGVCGKAWVIPGSGLNVYMILVARSGVGKEALHSGLGALVSRLKEGVPGAGAFVDFSDFASGPALAKACAAQSSFVNVAGEFGRKLQRLATEARADGPMQQYRTVLTNLYQKSGPTSIVGGITYSNKDSNVNSVSGVAFSLIGESTPETFYACLTESMMEDGFLSRFTVVEYDGPRPALNTTPALQPSNELTYACQALCVQAVTLLNNHQRCGIGITKDALGLANAFDKECDQQINGSHDEAWRQMWNRAHLKMLRFAGLLAVGDDHMQPVIQLHHIQWALTLVRADITLMQRRMVGGDVGQGDKAREQKVLSILRQYLAEPVADSYQVPRQMQKDAVVPRKYLQTRTNSVASFNQHKLGSSLALDQTLRSLCDSGYITEMDKHKAADHYTFQGRCFRIIQLPRA